MASSPGAGHALPPAILLMGPTAAGKTELACTLYERLPVHLISVDSAQVYRGLDVGTAKPDAQTLARYPHALIDIREPEETYSAADFVRDAEAEMTQAAAQGRLPVLVGGTPLYFRALLYGLDELPRADPDLRVRLAARAASVGWPALHRELAQRDPETAARIRASDSQRIQRALEVLELTGQGLSALHSAPRQPRFASLRLVVTPAARAVLHERITARTAIMLEQGLIEELVKLRARPELRADMPAMRSIGYRQVWQHLVRPVDEASLCEQIIVATRQLAKRQLTGFRKFQRTLWYDSIGSGIARLVIRQVAHFAQLQARRYQGDPPGGRT